MVLSALRTAVATPVGDPTKEVVPISAWAASTAYILGQIVCSGTIGNPGHYYQCTVAGTSGASAPTWTATGQTVSDNGVTWQDIGAGNGGDPSLAPHGLARFLTGLQGLANQIQASFSYMGLLTAKKASATACADGAAIWYDTAAAAFVTSAPTYGFYAGTARGAWISGQTTGALLLNGPLSLTNFAGGALTLTGALIAQSTLAVTGNSTLSGTLGVTGATTLTGLLTANGGIALGGKLALTASNTPVAAAGSTKTDAAAVGAQDIITISSDSAAKGVKLLTGAPGQIKRLINTTATACKLYPASGGTLSGLTADSPVTIAASHMVICYCVAADTWYVEDAGAVLVS